jgi:nucleoid DNA-binding protein
MLTNQDKPRKLSLKAFLIKKLAVKMMVSEGIITAVIDDQFNSALKAMDINSSVELSGFGKFLFKEAHAYKIEQSTKDMLAGLKPIPKAGSEEHLQKQLEYIQTKLYGNKTDSRGLEEQPNQESRSRGGGKNEVGDLSNLSTQLV